MDWAKITELGGMATVAIAVVYYSFRLMGNHMSANTRALTKLTACIDKLHDLIDRRLT